MGMQRSGKEKNEIKVEGMVRDRGEGLKEWWNDTWIKTQRVTVK